MSTHNSQSPSPIDEGDKWLELREVRDKRHAQIKEDARIAKRLAEQNASRAEQNASRSSRSKATPPSSGSTHKVAAPKPPKATKENKGKGKAKDTIVVKGG